jgi:hypothetical protein
MKRKKSTRTLWYENWWAGEDLNAVSNGNTSDQKNKSRGDREASVRWAARQPRGGVIRRMLG